MGIGAVAVVVRPSGWWQMEVLNEQTQARQVRPFTTSFGPRFDPLPIEDEGHQPRQIVCEVALVNDPSVK